MAGTPVRSRPRALGIAAGWGALAGLFGVAVMTTGEKIEQALTHRPDSYIPARTLLTLLGRQPDDNDRPALWNHLMHWATGVVLGALRGVWAAVGLRGLQAHLAHTVVRLSTDQTLENSTGVGAPPSSWPRGEWLVDVTHKVIYSIATGIVAERFIAPDLVSNRGQRSH